MIDVAASSGAAYIGFVFFPKSPRNVSIEQAAGLAAHVPIGVAKVALVVDPDDALLDQITAQVPIDMIQLHGHETTERVAQVKSRYGLPVMKVVGLADASDLADLEAHARVADQILVETKPPKGADRPGGNGVPFDWRLVAGRRWPCPWMLAGGLTPQNVGEAIAQSGTRQVDVSSGVESSKGVKDAVLIRAFLDAANS